MIQKLALNMARLFARQKLVEEAETKIYAYGFELLLSTVSSILPRILYAAIQWVPYLSKLATSTRILSSDKLTTGTIHPVDTYTKQVDAKQDNLRYPSDHLTVRGLGVNINYIYYGYSYTVWAI
ncbi:MAG: hypothetical protein LBL83_05380 [Clostridiales bacterium]|jgi:hypothetical protein|nr:hypothetical protein [Clostridiales bacterium]